MIGNICYCTSDETLTVYINGGSNNFTQMEPFKFLPIEVHLNPESMVKILVVKDVASILWLHISMDSRK